MWHLNSQAANLRPHYLTPASKQTEKGKLDLQHSMILARDARALFYKDSFSSFIKQDARLYCSAPTCFGDKGSERRHVLLGAAHLICFHLICSAGLRTVILKIFNSGYYPNLT